MRKKKGETPEARKRASRRRRLKRPAELVERRDLD
jgi:hypothetical protein